MPETRCRLSIALIILMATVSAKAAPVGDDATSIASSAEEPAVQEDTSQAEDASERLMSEEALARFQKVLQRKPLHKPAFEGMVSHFAEQGKLGDLVKVYEEKAAALPDEANLRIVLARLCLRSGKADRAAEIIDSLGESLDLTDREDSKLLVFKSEVYQRIGRIDDARKELERAFEQAKTVSEQINLAEALADLHLRASDKEKAANVLVALADRFPDNYLHRKRLADDLAQRSLHKEAITQYETILSLVKDETDRRCEVLRQLGRSLENLNRQEEAISRYTEAIGLLSGDHWMQQELHERIVSLYRGSGRLDDLVAYCRQQIERSPTQTSMRGFLADVLAAKGEIDEAKNVLSEAVELFPEDLALSDKRIAFLERVEDHAAAADEYERIIVQYPDDMELYVSYGRFLARNEKLEAARNQWKHVLNNELTNATLANRLASHFETYELFDDAVECYERAITLEPGQAQAYTSLSRLWYYRGDKDKAKAVLDRMSESNPDDAGIHEMLCQALMQIQMTDEALTAITRACELSPEDVKLKTIRSDLLVRAGHLDQALEVRREAVSLMKNVPQQGQAINILVSMYATAKKVGELKKAEIERLESDPNDIVSMMLLAKAADLERDFSDARKWLTKLLEVDPTNEEGRTQLAKLFEATGDVDSAVAEYQRLIDLHPVRARQFYQNIADLKLRYQDKAGAIETFQQMVQAAPDNATVIKEVAEQLARLGEYEKAIARYEECLALQPDRHEVRFAYAKVLEDDGRLKESLAEFKIAALQTKDRDTASEALGKLHEVAERLGGLEDLMEELEVRVESNPDDTLIARTLGDLLIREYEYSRAMDMLDVVLRHNPRDAELQLVKAELLRRLTRFDEALDTYRRVLRFANVDRDFVLGEIGKACFEAGRIEEARRNWKKINHRLYAGTLLRNNGLVNDAIEVLREGIRLKPDDYGLHRNLIKALQVAGKTDEALEAIRRLLDLEPDNIFNIQQVAKAYLERGDRKAAAEVAGRLFSAGVGVKKGPGSQSQSSQYGSMSIWAASIQSAWSGWGLGSSGRNNLERAVQFFQENGLLAELEEIIEQQLVEQPDNAVLRHTAVRLFGDTFGKPTRALDILEELETAEFPIEYQEWLGQCSQQDHFRVCQYQLVASKPALRDERLAVLEPKETQELTREEKIELAVIRQSQGLNDKAIELLKSAVEADSQDLVAASALVDALIGIERFEEAEPYARDLVDMLAGRREQLEEEMTERVRRDFVRTLPLRFQLQVTDELMRDIALKWTLGQAFVADYAGFVRTMGYFRAKLSLATIYAKTDRMQNARTIWQELRPTNPADANGWTTLASVAQLHDQQDLAFEYYKAALAAAKVLATDPLLQQIYGGSLSQIWYGEEQGIDSSFNKIVEAFASNNELVELCDFLRETDQQTKAKLVVDQYKLHDELKNIYKKNFEDARASFRESSEDPILRSVLYLMHASKYAEICDYTGDWPAALQIYTQYLEDFPYELALLTTIGEVAETQEELLEAIEWEKKVITAKEYLSRHARDWALREVFMTPAVPRILEDDIDRWEWSQRWGKQRWWYGGNQNKLERSSSWMRIAQLYIAMDNIIAAGDAMERALGVATMERQNVAMQILGLIRQRQIVSEMLPVLRTLAVHMPTDEQVQLAFAESLIANDKSDVAAEVYKRLLRRGVSNAAVLAQVSSELKVIEPGGDDSAPDTIESIEAEVAENPDNANARMRLAKAYYYSLQIDKALESLVLLEETAPHLEGLQDLLIEIYTIKQDTTQLLEALREKIKRTSDEDERNNARQRLAEELLANGEVEETLKILEEMCVSKNPSSYQRAGMLLHYFGKHDEAIERFKLAKRSQSGGGGMYGQADTTMAQSMVIKGDLEGAKNQIIEAIDDTTRQMSQYGGMVGMWSMFDNESDHFGPFVSLFVLEPELQNLVEQELVKRSEENPSDPMVAKILMQFYRRIGREGRAKEILESMAGKGATDQTLVMGLIDQAISQKQYEKAIELAQKFIEQQPKPKLPPGVPPQFAGMMTLMSARNMMLCKLGDVYWKMEDKEKAFDSYKQIVDKDNDETRIAFAVICLMRDRVEEAQQIVEEALEKQQVKAPNLLQFRALLAALNNKPRAALDYLADALEASAGQAANPWSFDESGLSVGTLGQMATTVGQLDRFVEIMEERIKKNPNKWEEYRTLVQMLRNAGRYSDAMAVLDRAGEIKSMKRDVLRQRISWMEGYAPSEELIPLYEELIELSEKKVKGGMSSIGRFFGMSQRTEPVDTSSQRDRLGQLLWWNGEQDRAIEVWTARMNMKAPDTHVRMAQRFRELEDFERAEASLMEALKLDPENLDARQGLARLCLEKNDDKAALPHLREVYQEHYERMTSGDGNNSGYNNRYYYQSQRRYSRNNSDQWDANTRLWADRQLHNEHEPESLVDELMITTMTGDWQKVRELLEDRRQELPYDPMVWLLWARSQERAGNWEEAAEAWQYVRRLKRTSLPLHREQLKLILAGKQIKDAAAGIKKEQDPTAGGMSQNFQYGQTSYHYNYGWYSNIDSETSHLAALWLKLGQYKKAEHLQLMSSNSSEPQYILPAMSELMWQQGAKDRAQELLRLATILGRDDGQDLLIRYAAMLSEVGKTDQAVELLVSTYSSYQRRNYYNPMSAMYGYYGGNDSSFEDWQEESCASALEVVLRKTGRFDEILGQLEQRVADDPNDTRLSKLVLSLHMRERNWGKAEQLLTQWCELRPSDMSIKTELLHVYLQQKKWDGALGMLDEIRKETDAGKSQWSCYEAFVHLLSGETSKAVAAIEPLLEDKDIEAQATAVSRFWTLLAVARDYDRLVDFLRKLKDNGLLNEEGHEIMSRILRMKGEYQAAIQLVLEEYWKRDDVFTEDYSWHRILADLIHEVTLSDRDYGPGQLRPVDRALITMIEDGPQAGVKAFQELLGESENRLEVLRGLVFAAEIAGETAVAVQANHDLVEMLANRRLDTWRDPGKRSLGDRASSMLSGMKSHGLDAASILGMSMSFGNLTEQLLQSDDSSDAQQKVKYEELWRAYAVKQPELLIENGDFQQCRTLLKEQARFASSSEYAESRRDPYRYRYYSSGSYYSYQYGNDDDTKEFPDDWRKAFRGLVKPRFLYEQLLDQEIESPGRIPESIWVGYAESLAALGRQDEAKLWRDKSAKAGMLSMFASDTPQIQDSNSMYSWRWRSYRSSNGQDVVQLKNALRASPKQKDDGADEEPKSRIRGDANEPWELALIDKDVEGALLAHQRILGSGWGGTQLFSQLLTYYKATEQPEKVLQLIEQVFNLEELAQTSHLSSYMEACLELGDDKRIAGVIELARQFGEVLDDNVRLLELVMLRREGKHAEADSLENELIGMCRAESINPYPLEPEIMPRADSTYDINWARQRQVMERQMWRYPPNGRSQSMASRLATVTDLANALGLHYTPEVADKDLTLSRIRGAYASHHLHNDAVRIMDLELANDQDAMSPRDKARFLQSKALHLFDAGKEQEARQLAVDLEKFWLNEIEEHPADADAYVKLAEVYASKFGGKAYEKAYQNRTKACELDYSIDRTNLTRAWYLVKLGRESEAWRLYDDAIRRGVCNDDSTTLFRAGECAWKAGDKERARQLLRQALWREPQHDLAKTAMELIDE